MHLLDKALAHLDRQWIEFTPWRENDAWVLSGRESYIVEVSHIVVGKGDIFWEGGVHSGSVAFRCLRGVGLYSGKEG